jgi:hypothetical protein
MPAPRLALLVGAPRSGTTWLQGMLGAHPRVASPQETDLFSRYVAPLDEAWAWQLRGGPQGWVARRLKGLPTILTLAQFDELVDDFVARIVHAALALKPGSDVVLEKSPAHSMHIASIRRHAPGAPIVHVIRDGRDVAASLVRAGAGWGAFWAPRDIAAAADTWATHLRGAREAAGDPAHYHEVRYEELRRTGAPALVEVFAAIGVAADEAECAALLDAQRLDRMAESTARSPGIIVGGEFAEYAQASEPEGFFGDGSGWSQWTAADRVAFAEVAGDLLVELGYEPDDAWVGDARRVNRRVHRARRQAARVARAMGTRVARVLEP